MSSNLSIPSDSPKHVAIVMDGNGRWAQAQSMPRLYGHHHGAEALKRTIELAGELGVKYLTVYAFSSENWKRPLEEVSGLLSLMRSYLTKELKKLHDQGIRLRFIGDQEKFPSDMQTLFRKGEELTKENTQLHLTVAVGYGSRDEITRVCRNVSKKVLSGELNPDRLSEEVVGSYLDTFDLPEVDLFVRTGGEQRISNYLLWQAAYAELVFVDVMWPDFGKKEFENVLTAYSQRNRRYGGVAACPIY